MNKGINLLGSKKKSNTAPALKKLRLLRLIAICMLFIVSASSITLFILISLTPLPKLKEQERISQINLSHFSSDITKLQVLKDRLNSISNILSKRPSYDKKIDLIKSNLPHEITIKSLSLEKNSISLEISSQSLLLLDTFLNKLISDSGKDKDFSKITITSLSKEEMDNSYLLGLTLLTYE